jgi:hypothetical protein
VRRLPLAFAVLALAGCGGGHGHTQTVGAYGNHPATTVAAAPGGPAVCRQDARVFASDARRFIAHTKGGAYPADLYYVILRQDLADFQARACARTYIHDVLTAAERRVLAAALPSAMAAVVR